MGLVTRPLAKQLTHNVRPAAACCGAITIQDGKVVARDFHAELGRISHESGIKKARGLRRTWQSWHRQQGGVLHLGGFFQVTLLESSKQQLLDSADARVFCLPRNDLQERVIWHPGISGKLLKRSARSLDGAQVIEQGVVCHGAILPETVILCNHIRYAL